MSAMIPFRPLADILAFDRRFTSAFEGGPWVGIPRVDVKDAGEHLELVAELPGMTPEQVDVSVENGVLTLQASADKQKSEADGGYVWRERRRQSFRRSFRLPQGTGSEQVAASMENGLLTITVEKAAAPAATRIAIGSAAATTAASEVETTPTEAETPAAS